jgi:hypothetical protein
MFKNHYVLWQYSLYIHPAKTPSQTNDRSSCRIQPKIPAVLFAFQRVSNKKNHRADRIRMHLAARPSEPGYGVPEQATEYRCNLQN